MDYGQQSQYGGYSQPRNSIGGGNIRSSPTQSPPGAYAAPQSSAGGGGGIARVDRSSQINDYVAKQKQAKLNAPLIKKENQRLAEARVMSASRSTKSSVPSDDGYLDDHSHLAPPNDEYQNGRPISGVNSRNPPPQQQQHQYDRRQSGGAPTRAAGPPKSVTYESDREPAGGGGGGGSNAELARRVVTLEDQIRLLKQQNRIFLSFMQNTETQLAELRGAAPPAAAPAPSVERSRSRMSDPSGNGAAPTAQGGSGYPNNMSQGTKQVLQRSQSERQTQPPATASTGRAGPGHQPQQSSPSLSGMRGGGSNGDTGGFGSGDFDQTFAPLDDDKSRERERLKSAKKKAGLLNLREKMAQKGTVPPAEQAGGRGYQANAYQDQYDDPPSQNAGYGYAGGAGPPGGAPYGQASARVGGSQQHQQPPQQLPRTSAGTRNPNAGGPPPASASRRNAPPPPADDYDDGYGGTGGGGGGGNDSFGGSGVPPGADEEVETFPCPNCDRRFNEIALAKHVAKQLCKQKPRKVFNMAQARLEHLAADARAVGIKLPLNVPPVVAGGGGGGSGGGPKAGGNQNQPLKKKAKWRVEHEKFMQAIQAGKQLQSAIDSGVPLSSLPPPVTREEDDDRVPCPHCGRKFSSNVADRHIPHCKTTVNKPKATTASAARLGSTARKR